MRIKSAQKEPVVEPIKFVEIPLREADADLRNQIAAWYCDVFNDPETFNDSYTLESAAHQLFGEAHRLNEYLTCSFSGERLVGLNISVVGPMNQVLLLRELPAEFRTDAMMKRVLKQVTWFVDESDLVMISRETGVHKDFRGEMNNAVELILRAAAWAVGLHVRYGLTWTSRKSPMYGILRGCDFRDIYDFGGEHELVFMGDSPDAFSRLQKARSNKRMIVERLKHQRYHR